MNDFKHLQIEDDDDITMVHLRGPWIQGFTDVDELSQELYHLVEAENRLCLVLDMAAVEFLSSSALGKLILLNSKLTTRGGYLKFCNLQPNVLDVFLTCKLDRLFTIKKTMAECVAPA